MLDDDIFQPSQFEPVKLLYRCGHSTVFYKGKAKEVPETEQERALAEVAAKKWARYQDVGVKSENLFMQHVKDMGTEASNQFARGAAASQTNAQFSQTPALSKPVSGLGLNSGAAKSNMFSKAMSRATAGAENTTGAALSREDQYAGGVQDVVAMGQGQSAQSQSGLSDLAIMANQRAGNQAVMDFNRRASNMEAAGTLVGAGAELKYGDKIRENMRKPNGLSRTTGFTGDDTSQNVRGIS